MYVQGGLYRYHLINFLIFIAISKNGLRLRKKREAKKAKKEQTLESPNVNQNQNHAPTTNHHPVVSASNGIGDSEITDDPEKLKKIKKIRSVSIANYQSVHIKPLTCLS